MKVLHVTIYRWFRKSAGNSYFSVRAIYIDENGNETIIKLPFKSGYGSHPEFQLVEEMKKMGILKGESNVLSYVCREEDKIKLFIDDHETTERECKRLVEGN